MHNLKGQRAFSISKTSSFFGIHHKQSSVNKLCSEHAFNFKNKNRFRCFNFSFRFFDCIEVKEQLKMI